jgi:hypothetical protein
LSCSAAGAIGVGADWWRKKNAGIEDGSHGSILLLLFGHRFFKRFDLAMLFEELVEQHRVHGFVAAV